MAAGILAGCTSVDPDEGWRRRLTEKRLGEIQHACRLLESHGRLPVDQATVPDLHALVWSHFGQRFLERRRDVPAYLPGVGFLDGWGEAFRLMQGRGYRHYSSGPDRINDDGAGDDIVGPPRVAGITPERLVGDG